MEKKLKADQDYTNYIGMSLEEISDGIIVVDNNTTIIYCNKIPEKLIKNKKNIIGANLFKIIPGGTKNPFQSNYKEAVLNRKVIDSEISFPGPEKTTYWSEMRICPFDEGAVIFFFDITERKKEESRNKLLMDILEENGEGIAFLDMKGFLTYFNKAFADIHGYDSSEITGKHVSFFYQPDHSVDGGKSMKEAETFSGEMRHVRKDGSTFHAMVRNTPLTASDGKMRGIIKNLNDISNYKRVQETQQEDIDFLLNQKIASDKKNMALMEMFDKMDFGKEDLQRDVKANIEKLLLPPLERLKLKGESKKYIDLLKKNLEELASSFGSKISERALNLSPREIEVCNMIRNGLSTKEISRLLSISPKTTERYRNNIRQKLRLVRRKINLSTYLKSL